MECARLSAQFPHDIRYVARWVATALLIALVGCASGPGKAGSYTVRRGDTLYAIAQRYHVEVRDLASWNGIGRDNVIHPGQVLRLYASSRSRATSKQRRAEPSAPAPRAATALPMAPPVPWQWPVDGGTAVLTTRPNGGSGLMIRGTAGQEVKSAGAGRVVYTGSGLLGYGQLLIIKHNESYLSAYGHTATLSVHEGDYVLAGQRIGTMGTDTQGTPALYFEIRINGAAANPLTYLPSRSSP
jgi:lipoprotein NlpD